MDVAEALDLIAAAIDSDAVAHGYLVCGDLGGNCREFAMRVLDRLFPGAERQLAERTHPDVFWLEPQGRSRTIKIERGKEDRGPGMREGLLEPMSRTSYSGGWKVGVIVGADRMQKVAANAFLKTLEEPAPHTTFLLLTDQPTALLPTIVSRCQRIDLGAGAATFTGERYDAMAEIFRAPCPKTIVGRQELAERLVALLDKVKDETPDEELALERKRFFRTVLSFVRGWLVRGELPRAVAFDNVEVVESAYRRSERAVGDEAVISFMMDRMVMP